MGVDGLHEDQPQKTMYAMDHTSSQGRQKSSLLRWWRCYQWQGHWTRTHSLWDNIITATYCSWELQRSTLDPPTKNGRGHGWTYHKQEGHFPSNALENHNPNQGSTTIVFLCKELAKCQLLNTKGSVITSETSPSWIVTCWRSFAGSNFNLCMFRMFTCLTNEIAMVS